MMRELQQGLDVDERRFCSHWSPRSLNWPLLGAPNLDQFPALRWKQRKKLERLPKTNARKFAEQTEALARLLG